MSDRQAVPKLCGADVELANFVLGGLHYDESVRTASHALLTEVARIVGAPVRSRILADHRYDIQDTGRCFFPTNGGCAYLDLNHLELNLPEVTNAYDHVAAWHAMLRIARAAQLAANVGRDPDARIEVLANNSDGLGNSFGSHLNFLVSRDAWDSIIHRRPHYLGYLASFQVSSLPITGQGKVGSENGAQPVEFQLSQRADFFEVISGEQTTWRRPLINTRDEPLCGKAASARADLARLHVIFFDSTLCQVSSLLRIGMMQLVLAMIEAHAVDSRLVLDDPLAALRAWSHDPSLQASARLLTGESVTAVQLQRRFFDAAAQFVASGETAGIVPRAQDLLTTWDDTLRMLEDRKWAALARRLDWVLKRSLLAHVLEQRPDLTWASPEIKHLDHLYASLDPVQGLYWSMEGAGQIDRVVADETIERFVTEPPDDTRAWGRAMLLRRTGLLTEEVDWDVVRARLTDEHGYTQSVRIDLADPLGATRADWSATLQNERTLPTLIRALHAVRVSTANNPGQGGEHGIPRTAPRAAAWESGE